MTTAILEIPLNKLVPSMRNVRRTGRESGIAELAASIAAHGLLQSLAVRSVRGADGEETGKYEVLGGGRRHAALKLLATRKQVRKAFPVPCVVSEEGGAEEVSLAENVMREPLHPADQFEAFDRLHREQGVGIEDIAARFGVTPTVVKQRMKLGAASPKLMELYREGAIDLDQLMAFCLTDDHERQEYVLGYLGCNKEADMIRRVLTAQDVPANDRRAVFVGAEAFEAAGGTVMRDLFDEQGRGYFTDSALLNRLVVEKLEAIAVEVRAEGWKWVVASADFPHGNGCRRVYARQKELTEKQRKRLQKVEAQYEALAAEYETVDEVPADVTEKLDRFTAEIDSTYAFDPDDVARGGVFISLSREGEACIERGFIRRHDDKQPEADEASVEVAEAQPEDGASAEAEEAEGPLSDKLIADLTAHRSAALEDALAEHPDVAFTALVHALALAVFYPAEQASCLQIKASEAWLANHAPGIDDAPALQAVGQRHAQWARQLPSDAAGLWEFVIGLDYDSRMALMAHCVAITVNAVRLPHERRSGALAHANALAAAVNLDMTAYWTPTVDSYFGRVTKSRILDAVREGASPEAAERIAGMKKQPMAEAAAHLLVGKGWLPEVLHTVTGPSGVSSETVAQEASMAA